MPNGMNTTERDAVRESFRQLSDGMSTLVKGHLDLAKIELTQDIKAVAKDSAVAVAGVPFLLCGYLLLWIAIGCALALLMPLWAAFLICAGANLLAGGGLVVLGSRGLKKDKVDLPSSKEELEHDKEWIDRVRRTLKEPTREELALTPGGTAAAETKPVPATQH